MSLRSLSALACTALTLACSTPAEIIVVVDAEETLQLRDLRIETLDGEPAEVVVDHTGVVRPWTLALRPSAGQSRAEVTVTATTQDGTEIQQFAQMDFVEGERLLLYFYLSENCTGEVCEGGSCFDGECVDVVREPCPFREPLPRGPVGSCPSAGVDGGGDGGPRRDAGSDGGLDAGPIDAGPDAGAPVLEACEPSLGVCDVDVGEQHACAISSNGDVYCWGSNFFGEIGQRPPHPVSSPALVSGISDGVDVALGLFFSCVLSTDGNVRCFGENNLQQLGRETGGDSHEPVLVDFPEGANPTQIVAGNHFACALTTDGEVYCWGANGQGQLGGTAANPGSSASPLQVRIQRSPFTPVGLSAGAAHACAWSAEGSAYCWGQMDGGRLDVQSFADVRGIATGDTHTCVLDGQGTVECIGGSATMMQAPDEPVAAGAVFITAGSNATCALSPNLRTCWGANPGGHLAVLLGSSGTTGIGPSEGADANQLRTLAMGGELSCGIGLDGTLQCWGYDLSGGTGQGAALEVDAVEVILEDDDSNAQTVSELAAGAAFTCGRSAAEVFCWGAGALGQQGDGLLEIATAGPRVQPVGSLLSFGASRIVAGSRHACAHSSTHGQLTCWGDNSERALFNSSVAVFPQPAGTRLVQSPAGAGEGTLCWHGVTASCVGRTDSGQGGVSGNQGVVREIPGVTNVSGVAVGRNHACALGTDLTSGVFCWGDNSSSQLGQTEVDSSATAMPVMGSATIASVAAGTDFTCGMDAAQNVVCWGDNTLGQLGRTGFDAAVTSSGIPAPIDPGITLAEPLERLVAGGAGACAYNERELICWGDNRFGQLDPRGARDFIAPAPMDAPPVLELATIQSVALGPRHRCVTYREDVNPLDRTFCWGSDEHGRSGSGRPMVLPPTEISLP